MAFIMEIVGLASGEPSPFDGKFLVDFDPGRDGVDPNGRPMHAHITVTDDESRAMLFGSAKAMHAIWTAVDPRQPVRADGRPNRPLTTFSIATKMVEVGAGL